ncbi:unnamed protein product, partial [Mesorhabditis belari]|uniref:Palmitoyltransferase n=1 Tax=Mesorhabditis belari TaxID=2138241 RepID=A0AAF3J9Z5_9BILA
MRSMNQNDRPFHCLLDTVHCKHVFPIVLGYHMFTAIFFSYILFPHALLMTIPALAVCLCATFGFLHHHPQLLVPFRIYVYISIFFLLFLGLYMFFISVFEKPKHEALSQKLFAPSPEFFSLCFHLVSNLATLFDLWQLPLINTTAKYLNSLNDGTEPCVIQLPVIPDALSATFV